MDKLTPNRVCKMFGLDGNREVIEATRVSAQTLTNWCYQRPELYLTIVRGVIARKESERFQKNLILDSQYLNGVKNETTENNSKHI